MIKNINKQFLLIIFAILFSSELVIANSIGISPNLEGIIITSLQESNKIVNRDIEINIFIKIEVNKEYLKKSEEFTIYFTPFEIMHINQGAAENVKFKICEGNIEGSLYGGGDVSLDCTNELPYKKNHTIWNPIKNYKEYNLILNASKINFSEGNVWKRIFVNINYTIPNFIEKGLDKTVRIGTNCFPTEICSKAEITKSLILPKDIILRNYPTDTLFYNFEKELKLLFFEFKPYITRGHPTYADKIVMYTDRKEEEVEKRNWFWLGIIVASIISAILNLVFYILNNKKQLKIIREIIKKYVSISQRQVQLNKQLKEEIVSILKSQKKLTKDLFNTIKYKLKIKK